MRTPQWNGDDGLTTSTVASGKFQRRLVPVKLFCFHPSVHETNLTAGERWLRIEWSDGKGVHGLNLEVGTL